MNIELHIDRLVLDGRSAWEVGEVTHCTDQGALYYTV